MGISKSYLKDKFLSRGGNTRNNFSVKKSTITGANKGLFSNNPIPQGGFIGLAHENNQPVGTLGRMHNHSENPNMQSVKVGNQRYVYATKDIQPGEELTTNYRLQPELEQPEDFMGTKRFAQKGTYQMGGTIGIPGVNGQVVSSGPQPLTSVKKTRGPITKTKKGDVKTMPTKAVKKILKNIK